MPKQFLKSTLIVTLFLIFTAKAQAYTPPIGIPDPGMWGSTHPIDSVAPATSEKCPNWPAAETVGCFYVDNTDPNATDTGNVYGYPDKPRLTVPSQTSYKVYAAGSYVEVHGGPYATNMYLKFTCTAESPCWFRGVPGSLPIFANLIYLKNSTYLFMENIEFNGGNNGCLSLTGTASDHVIIRNSKFKNRAFVSNTSAIGMTPDQGGITHDIIVYNSEFSELGDWATTVDQDFHGIGPGTFGRTAPTELHHVWMLNNSFYHISGNGIQVNAGNKNMVDYVHHIYVGKNIGHANRQAPFWSKQASHVIMSQNVAYDNRPHGSQPGNGIGYQYGPDNLWIIFNEIYDSSNGIRQSDTQDSYYDPAQPVHNVYIMGNLIHDIQPADYEDPLLTSGTRPGAAITFWSGSNYESRHVIDNTIYNSSNGFNTVQIGPVDVRSNIISGVASTGWHIYSLNNNAFTHLNKNNLYSVNDAERIFWKPTGYTSLAAYNAVVAECLDCLTADPQLVDPAGHNFVPAAGSPVIGAGVRDVSYDIFESLYGLSIAYDFNGNPRPTSGPWTLGAYECTSQNTLTDNIPPATPDGVIVL